MRIIGRKAISVAFLVAGLVVGATGLPVAARATAPAALSAATPTALNAAIPIVLNAAAPKALSMASSSCPDVRGGGAGAVEDTIVKWPSAAVHDGPAAVCTVINHLDFGTTVYKWCSWLNYSTGNYWTYTNWGWIYSGYLNGGLSDFDCDWL